MFLLVDHLTGGLLKGCPMFGTFKHWSSQYWTFKHHQSIQKQSKLLGSLTDIAVCDCWEQKWIHVLLYKKMNLECLNVLHKITVKPHPVPTIIAYTGSYLNLLMRRQIVRISGTISLQAKFPSLGSQLMRQFQWLNHNTAFFSTTFTSHACEFLPAEISHLYS